MHIKQTQGEGGFSNELLSITEMHLKYSTFLQKKATKHKTLCLNVKLHRNILDLHC